MNIRLDNNEWLLKYEQLSSLSDNFILVGTVFGKIVCTAKCFIETKIYDPICHIEDVVVDVDNRHKGYGNQLLEYCCDIASEYKCYKIVCNSDVKDFYIKCGFTQEGYEFTKRLK